MRMVNIAADKWCATLLVMLERFAARKPQYKFRTIWFLILYFTVFGRAINII